MPLMSKQKQRRLAPKRVFQPAFLTRVAARSVLTVERGKRSDLHTLNEGGEPIHLELRSLSGLATPYAFYA